jgi:hypothetical protein
VDSSYFFPGTSGTLLLTNSHVLSERRFEQALPPRYAVARFPDREPVRIVGEVCSSRPDELDFTFVRLESTPSKVRPIPVAESPCEVESPPQFLYIIGYPGGGSQSFSLNDNVFLARSEDRLHYRTPTEKGSSGSPVLDPITWEAVALHHAGASTMDSLSGAGTYEANEGICLCAIRQDTKKKGSAAP